MHALGKINFTNWKSESECAPCWSYEMRQLINHFRHTNIHMYKHKLHWYFIEMSWVVYEWMSDWMSDRQFVYRLVCNFSSVFLHSVYWIMVYWILREKNNGGIFFKFFEIVEKIWKFNFLNLDVTRFQCKDFY